jgi:hypothetical protein
VSAEPTDGNAMWNPFVFATLPVYIPVFSSVKNLTGAPLYPTRASFTRFLPSVERSALLQLMRTEFCTAATGKPGNDSSRLLSVSG